MASLCVPSLGCLIMCSRWAPQDVVDLAPQPTLELLEEVSKRKSRERSVGVRGWHGNANWGWVEV